MILNMLSDRHNANRYALKISGLLFAVSLSIAPGKALAFDSPDILVLGDSQITFGAGPSFLSFFKNVKKICGKTSADRKLLKGLGRSRVAVIGVRSTSLGTWTQRTKAGKKALCDVDPKWKVNAGSYGTVNRTKNLYVQIGQGKNYQFCASKRSAFETMFSKNYYDPKLLVMSFLGNSSARWAKSPAAALSDVKRASAQLPLDLPCVFMTTAPTYQKKIIDVRLRAQINVQKAFAKTGRRCSFVEGFTPRTIRSNMGVKTHFRRKKSGEVKDPFHPNKNAAKKFFTLRKNGICSAVLDQLRRYKS